MAEFLLDRKLHPRTNRPLRLIPDATRELVLAGERLLVQRDGQRDPRSLHHRSGRHGVRISILRRCECVDAIRVAGPGRVFLFHAKQPASRRRTVPDAHRRRGLSHGSLLPTRRKLHRRRQPTRMRRSREASSSLHPSSPRPLRLCGKPGACATGSCCTGPGQCQDEVFGAAIDMPTCEGLGGRYLGGIRCQGGYCQNDPRFSCGSDADCASPGPGGMCVGLGAIGGSTQPLPGLRDHRRRQLPDVGRSRKSHAVRRSNGRIVADDLIAGPGTGQISQVCVWGAYLVSDADRSSMIDCWQAALSDNSA